MNLADQPVRAVSKFVNHNRNNPTRKQRGHIRNPVRKELRERSGGVCERCYKAEAVQGAHTLRRLDIKGRTTVEDLAHLCVPCHNHCDSTISGKVFKQQFRKLMYLKAGRMKEYYE